MPAVGSITNFLRVRSLHLTWWPDPRWSRDKAFRKCSKRMADKVRQKRLATRRCFSLSKNWGAFVIKTRIKQRVRWRTDMCRNQKSGSKIRRIWRQNRMSRSKIYRILRQNHLVRIQDLQDFTTKQKFRIQDPKDPTSEPKSQDPGSPGSHDETKV